MDGYRYAMTRARGPHTTPRANAGSEGSAGRAQPASADGAWRLAHMLDGFVTTQLLYVAATLGIADVLRDGPMSGAAIAAAVDADPGALTRVLRGLAAEDVLAETFDGQFALTPIGEALRGLRGAALARGDLYYRSAAGLLDAVRTGGTPFENVYGEPFFEHLARDREHEDAFQASMAGRAEQEADDVVTAYDFSGIGRIVDVGGGRGVLLARILGAAAGGSGVLIDRPAAIPEARRYLQSIGLADRTECLAVDFFASVPPGADAYVLSRILHDWDDADAELILATCRAAMAPTSRLLIVDAIMPERARDRPAAIRMDLHMMLLLGARERTEAEFRTLLERSGFCLERLVLTGSPAGLGVIEATPA
jgi:O-methyltransferase domain/Dimerisation domain